MNVLVTGCAGYLGSQLVPHLLACGHVVVGIDMCVYHNAGAMTGFWGHPNFQFLPVNVRDHDSYKLDIKWADAIIPLAGIVGAPSCDATSPVVVNAINRDAIRTLIERLSPQQYVLYPCSNSGYGHTSGDEACTEDQPLNPISLYGKSKVEAEAAVLSHGRGCSLRLATVYGVSPRMRFDLLANDLVRMVVHEGQVKLYQGGHMRSIAYIGNVVRAFGFALGRQLTGVYNVVEPEGNVTKRELAETISRSITGQSVVTECDGEDPDQRNYRVSNQKLIAEGFEYLGQFRKHIEPVIHLAMLTSPPSALRQGNRP